MKNILTISLLLAGLVQAKATAPIFHKSNGGLFGYKYVTTTTWPELDKTIVACTDPGLTRCKASVAFVMPDGPDLTPEIADKIGDTVTALLTPENTSGQLLYDGTFYVTYSYNIEADDLSYTVYSLGEAKASGFIQ